jgi:hypothetical protein
MPKNQELWDQIQELKLDLEQAKRHLLQNNGWHNTSRTPGSYWMWEKELAVAKVLVDEITALRIQESLDSGYYNDMEKKDNG